MGVGINKDYTKTIMSLSNKPLKV